MSLTLKQIVDGLKAQNDPEADRLGAQLMQALETISEAERAKQEVERIVLGDEYDAVTADCAHLEPEAAGKLLMQAVARRMGHGEFPENTRADLLAILDAMEKLAGCDRACFDALTRMLAIMREGERYLRGRAP